jgi:hypothetical protein
MMQLQLGDMVVADKAVFPSAARLRRESGTADLDDLMEANQQDQEDLDSQHEEQAEPARDKPDGKSDDRPGAKRPDGAE